MLHLRTAFWERSCGNINSFLSLTLFCREIQVYITWKRCGSVCWRPRDRLLLPFLVVFVLRELLTVSNWWWKLKYFELVCRSFIHTFVPQILYLYLGKIDWLIKVRNISFFERILRGISLLLLPFLCHEFPVKKLIFENRNRLLSR